MFTTGKGADYVAEKAESNTGYFSVGDELNELGYNHMFTDMLNALNKDHNQRKLFMMASNAILDAAYRSAKVNYGTREVRMYGVVKQVLLRTVTCRSTMLNITW